MKFISKRKQKSVAVENLGKDGKILADFIYRLIELLVKGKLKLVIAHVSLNWLTVQEIFVRNGYDLEKFKDFSIENIKEALESELGINQKKLEEENNLEEKETE